MSTTFGPRRSISLAVTEESNAPLRAEESQAFEFLDAVYRSLCSILFNYVPTSGHPGGSISSGHFVSTLLFDAMDYDFSNPERKDADIISYAAGHKALGLYGMWALRDEIVRIGARELLPGDERMRLRLEDLLGFRRNPTSSTPLFTAFHSKALDGHPTPATPFVRLSTGASGVGVAASFGLALAAADVYGQNAPHVHVVEGEGGLTPGRVAEALAFAGTASLSNLTLHLDWNQASIDSDYVTRDGEKPGDYVQWNPPELFYLHDWNVITVPNGLDFQQVIKAQHRASRINNGQPTAIIYRTIKGWEYGIQGRASHGAGHKMCSPGFFDTLVPLVAKYGVTFPACEPGSTRCIGGSDGATVEQCFWDSLALLRRILEANPKIVAHLADRLRASRDRLESRKRTPRRNAPEIADIYAVAKNSVETPDELKLAPGSSTTLRSQLGKVLNYYNHASAGAIFIAAADLLGSTSINEAVKDFRGGYFNYQKNPESRTLSIGGICEDAMAGILSGVASFGEHIGAGSSYGAFIAPLGHIAARLHAIGNQAKQSLTGEAYKPFVLICGHAGLKTGEDGPTHADPQPLQLLQENFPDGTAITLTPWDAEEIFHLFSESLNARPAVIAPFVTRPNEKVLDRAKLGLAPAIDARKGVYLLRKANGEGDGTVVLQESGVTYAFVQSALPLLEKAGIDLNVYYVASAELFDRLTYEEQQAIFPESRAQKAMGITGFTLATMYRWIRSDAGRRATLHPFQHGHYLGSGPGDVVIAEAGLDGESQFKAISKHVASLKK